MREVQSRFPSGSRVRERYVVETLLGEGGFGAVYRVRDRRVKSNVFALKEVLLRRADDRKSIVSEYDLLKRLDHPSLPRVYSVFEESKNSCVYMLMDYIDGMTLENLRHQQLERRFSFLQVLYILEPIVDAIKYLHAQRPPIVHCDIKPANIIVPAHGSGAILVDFGLAKEYEQEATTIAVRHCSLHYSAPEQYAYGITTRTDVYSLGATIYTLLTGEAPVDAMHRMVQISGKSSDPLIPANELVPTLARTVSEVLQQAMAIDSHCRFATIEEFWQALRDASQDVPGEKAAVLSMPESVAMPAREGNLPTFVAPPVSIPVSLSQREGTAHEVASKVGGYKLLFTTLAIIALLTGSAFGTGLRLGMGFSAPTTSVAAYSSAPQPTSTSYPPTTRLKPTASAAAPIKPTVEHVPLNKITPPSPVAKPPKVRTTPVVPSPTPTIVVTPTAQPTAAPTPTVTKTPVPTLTPAATPTPVPTATPSPEPTQGPSPTPPTPTATPAPSAVPSPTPPMPTATPTPVPVATPTLMPFQ